MARRNTSFYHPFENGIWMPIPNRDALYCINGHPKVEGNLVEVKDASRPKGFKRLCATCYRGRINRRRAKSTLPADTAATALGDISFSRPVIGGFGYHGVLLVSLDQQYTQCHICGRFSRLLANHIAHAHLMAQAEYKKKYSLPQQWILSSPSLSERRRRIFSELPPEKQKQKIDRLHHKDTSQKV